MVYRVTYHDLASFVTFIIGVVTFTIGFSTQYWSQGKRVKEELHVGLWTKNSSENIKLLTSGYSIYDDGWKIAQGVECLVFICIVLALITMIMKMLVNNDDWRITLAGASAWCLFAAGGFAIVGCVVFGFDAKVTVGRSPSHLEIKSAIARPGYSFLLTAVGGVFLFISSLFSALTYRNIYYQLV